MSKIPSIFLVHLTFSDVIFVLLIEVDDLSILLVDQFVMDFPLLVLFLSSSCLLFFPLSFINPLSEIWYGEIRY